MRLFTQIQTESWQNETIKAFARTNELNQLCWFVQMICPPPPKSLARTMTQQQRQDYRYRTACAPRDWIPYVEIGTDPIASRAEVEVLAGIFAYSNNPEIKFVPALCMVADVATQHSYAYGKEWDHVCNRCGSVFLSTLPNEVAICNQCDKYLYRMALQ